MPSKMKFGLIKRVKLLELIKSVKITANMKMETPEEKKFIATKLKPSLQRS